jgi:hypothetical protein
VKNSSKEFLTNLLESEPMRNRRLNSIETRWDDRGLFHKRRRWKGNLWLLALIVLATTLYYQQDQIPDLLLDGFKVIAKTIPNQPPASLPH